MSGSEKDDEDWTRYNRGLDGEGRRPLLRERWGKRAGKWTRDGGKFGGYKGGAPGESKGGGYQGQCWTCGTIGHTSSECRWSVAVIDEDDADCRKVEVILEMWRNSRRRRKKASAARAADPSAGHMRINAMICEDWTRYNRGLDGEGRRPLLRERWGKRAGKWTRDGGKFGGYKGGAPGESKGGGYQGQCWTCGTIGHTSSECRWSVAVIDEDDADCRKSGGHPGNVEEFEEEEEEGIGRPGCRSQCWAHEDQRDDLRGIREFFHDEFSKLFQNS